MADFDDEWRFEFHFIVVVMMGIKCSRKFHIASFRVALQQNQEGGFCRVYFIPNREVTYFQL